MLFCTRLILSLARLHIRIWTINSTWAPAAGAYPGMLLLGYDEVRSFLGSNVEAAALFPPVVRVNCHKKALPIPHPDNS